MNLAVQVLIGCICCGIYGFFIGIFYYHNYLKEKGMIKWNEK